MLIVVIGLLLLLMLIGFAFFTFANQEQSSAEYYAEASKSYSGSIPFDWALEQLIIGPRDNIPQSALWPGKHSLVPNMLGLFAANPNDTATNSYPTVPSDRHPYNGGFGINIIAGPAGQPFIDQNFDGAPDSGNGWLMTLNFSGAAQQSGQGSLQASTRAQIFTNFPAIDVGYTYPDINNAFLAYVAREPSTGNMIYTPSFHRPALLRDATTGLPYVNWQFDNTGPPTDTTTRVLRPHPGHFALLPNGTSSGFRRFLSAKVTVPGSNPHDIQYFGYVAGPSSRAFGVDLNNDGIFGQQGVWSNTPGLAPEFDADNDGDGKYEGVWVDLGHPPIILPDGRKMVPLFSFTVFEADSLFNANTASNVSWMPQSTGLQRPFYGAGQGQTVTPDPISHSNLGMSSPSEINFFWALIADPRNPTYLSATNQAIGVTPSANGPAPELKQYRGFFGLSNTNPASYDMSWVETANMDMVRMLWGCPKYTVTGGGNVQEGFTIDDVIAGRWGDVDYLLRALQFGNPGVFPPSNLALFPQPGIPGFDDNGNFFAGLTDAGYVYSNGFLGYTNVPLGGDPTNYQLPFIDNFGFLKPLNTSIALATPLFPSMIGNPTNSLFVGPNNATFNSPVTMLPFGQPLDYTGAGLWTVAGTSNHGQQANVFQPYPTLGPTWSPGMYLYYNQYQGSIFSSGAFASPVIPYQMALAATIFTPPYLLTGAMPAPPYQGLLTNYDTNTNGAAGSTNGVYDEQDEMVTNAAYAQSVDQQFSIDETAFMQLRTASDYTAAGGQSRLRSLASWSFELNLQAPSIRQRFTTASSDRKNHGFGASVGTNSGANPNRAWEHSRGNWDGTTVATSGQFPPMVIPANLSNVTGMDGLTPAIVNNNQITAAQVQAEPFRMELAALIGAKLNNSPVSPLTATLTPAFNAAFKTAPYDFRRMTDPVTPWQQQLRLNINRFLTAADPNAGFGTASTPGGATRQQNQQNPLRFRELTPHPTMAQWKQWQASNPLLNFPGRPIGTTLGATGSPANSNVLAFPSASNTNTFVGNPALQEYWARRDRQQMARDLYVMLYMFGGSGFDSLNNPIDYATQPNQTTPPGSALTYTNFRAVYQDWQLAEMAQFAVNIVDSLDRDDTITMFEYDKDLHDGWNLDDDPITPEGTPGFGTFPPPAVNDRGLVFGVEAQQLAFNEALVIVAPKVKDSTGTIGVNHPATPWDDSQVDHTFVYLETFNVSPYPVPVNNLNWQIVVLDPGTTSPNLPLVPQQTATVPSAAPGSGFALTALTLNDSLAYTTGSIPPGSPYTIGSRTDIGNDNVNNPPALPSTFVVDPTWSIAKGNPDTDFTNKNLTQMVPQYVPTNPATLNLNLDLLTAPGGSFVLTDDSYAALTGGTATSAAGGFHDMTTGSGNVLIGKFGVAVPQFVSTFALRRRLNLNRPAPPITPGGDVGEADNPFIEVDRITYANYNPVNDIGKPSPAPFPGFAAGEPVDANVDAFGNNGPAAGAFFNLRDVNDPSLIVSSNAGAWDIQPKLARLVSKQRRQPLDGYESSGGSSMPPGLPTYPTVWPNWPAVGLVPGGYAPSAAPLGPFTSNFPTARTAYYQNQTVCVTYGDLTPAQNVPFTYTNKVVFSPNTFGQTSQYLPLAFHNVVGGIPNNTVVGVPNNGSNSGDASSSTPFTLWQPHFDRDFASIGELLSVPLYGPSIVTQSLAPKDTSTTTNSAFNSLASEAPLPATTGAYYQPLVAQAKFFRPQYPINATPTPVLSRNPQFDNCWHRVLELLEVPSRANIQIENNLLAQYPWLYPQALQRSPGKMNLNGLRYGENFFGLLDDPGTFNLGATLYNPYNPFTGSYVDAYSYNDALEGAVSTVGNYRDWWLQFLHARDGIDPQTFMYLPGSPASRPFRPMSHYDNGANVGGTTNGLSNTDDTLLRTLPMDAFGGTLETRGLFEARTRSDLVNAAKTAGLPNPGNTGYPNSVDYYTRQRLLSKIAGNTTQRSNVFLVWISVGFFEGYNPPAANNPSVIQIGAEMTDQPRRRGFFVVDRSLLEEAWVPDTNKPENGYFDYSKFILYRKTLQ